MVGVTIVASVKDYRRMIDHKLRGRENFDANKYQLNLSTRYFTSPISCFDRGFYLNMKERDELLNHKHYLSKLPISTKVLTPNDIISTILIF